VLDLLHQHAPHEGTRSQNSVLLHDFCRKICEAQLTEMDPNAAVSLFHADVIDTAVCWASRAKYRLRHVSTLAPNFAQVFVGFYKSFTRLKIFSLRRNGASEKFRLNLQTHFLIPLFSVYVIHKSSRQLQ
jgi:hypothetical protein